MPCNSDYMEPTQKERRLQETAQLIIYVYEKIRGKARVFPLLPTWVEKAAKDIYTHEENVVPRLCYMLNGLKKHQPDLFEEVVYNSKDKMSRKLADWWEEHEEADRIRVEEEQEKQRRNDVVSNVFKRLSNAEIVAIREFFREQKA